MEREYGPEGQIIIRGFPKSTAEPYDVPSGPGAWERVRDFLQFYWPAIFILLVLTATSAGAIVAWTTSSDDTRALTEQELAALVAESDSDAAGGTDDGGAAHPLVSGAIQPSLEHLSIDVLSEPDGATVHVDFRPVGTTPLRGYRLPRGVYVLSVSQPDGARIDSVVILDERSERTFRFSPQPYRNTNGLPEARGQENPPYSAGSGVQARRDGSTTQRDAAGSDAREPTADVSPSFPRETPVSSLPASDPLAELVITSVPAGATVEIDGERRGTTPLHARGIAPGRRELRVTLDGFSETRDVLELESAQTVMRSYDLSALQGTVVVQVRPWGSIYLDGELLARDLDVRHPIVLSVGSYRIAAVHPVLGRREVEIRVRAGQTEEVTIDLSTAPPEDR